MSNCLAMTNFEIKPQIVVSVLIFLKVCSLDVFLLSYWLEPAISLLLSIGPQLLGRIRHLWQLRPLKTLQKSLLITR